MRVKESLERGILLLVIASTTVWGQEIDCELPPINFESQRIDVLGDYEKTQVCKLPRPDSLCPRVGPADNACRTIARAVGGVRNASCAFPNTCAFLVKSPVQHPSRPGFAYVSLCTPKYIGVIFPCRENNLVIANPFYRGVYVNDDPPPDVDPGRTIESGNIASNPHCDFPPLNVDALPADVLGDREKANVCSLPRPMYLCPRGKGEADEFCRKIARAVGGTSDPRCLRRNTCTFHVKKPVQHPRDPGEAYVSLCVPDGAGVIFPCRENNLVVIDPFFDMIDVTLLGSTEPPTEPAPNWAGSSSNGSRPAPPTNLIPDTKPSSSQDIGDILFGKYIAHKLTNMDPIQARIAEKLIAEVLFEAEMGTLNRNIKMVEVPFRPQPLPLHPDVVRANVVQIGKLQTKEAKNASVPLDLPLMMPTLLSSGANKTSTISSGNQTNKIPDEDLPIFNSKA